MSLRDLSRASGVSMGGLYAYFDSKTTLLNMILSEVTAAVQRVLSTRRTRCRAIRSPI